MADPIEELKKLVTAHAPESILYRLTSEEAEKLKNEFKKLPADYIRVLTEVGYGTYGKMAFTLYGGPIEPDEFFDEGSSKKLSGLLLLGDDYSGWMYAFDTSKSPWEMTLLDHSEIMPNEGDDPLEFSSFILAEFRRAFELG